MHLKLCSDSRGPSLILRWFRSLMATYSLGTETVYGHKQPGPSENQAKEVPVKLFLLWNFIVTQMSNMKVMII